MDNRPLKFEEWDLMRTQTVFVSATPGPWELEQTKGKFIDQVIRPTGLIDPVVEIRPAKNQVDDLMHECKKVIENNHRVLVTTLTKKMAEDLTEYLHENGIKVRYLHSDIDTLERIEIMRDLRMGVFDVLVGINLLREGLDIPECALVGILDADKEGFLRSETSLIQTIGRAACAGFVYALEQGKAFVESGLYKRALVIGSEHITWLLDWSDRNTAVLFGDGAGAVVVEESKDHEDGEIFSFVNGLSSDKLDILEVPNFGSAMDRFKTDEAARVTWTFDGQEIFKGGIRAMAKA